MLKLALIYTRRARLESSLKFRGREAFRVGRATASEGTSLVDTWR